MTFETMTGQVPASVVVGNRRFPARSDYETYFLNKGVIDSPESLWENPDLVVKAQRHWHTSGQNGCVFAQQILRTAPPADWRHIVLTEKHQSGLASPELDHAIHAAIEAPNCQVLSILFPSIVSSESLAQMIHILTRQATIILKDVTVYESLTTLALRVNIGNSSDQAWLMGFGPFEFLPKTRQAPCTEIAIRCKSKPDEQFHRLSKDKCAAHLADYPTSHNESLMEKVWQATLKNTREILAGEPDHFSAAKVTFTIPTAVWSTFCKA